MTDEGRVEGLVHWGAAGQPHPGESESGDLHLVRPRTGGLLLAVVDALGHGSEAAACARAALAEVERHVDEAITDIVRACHAVLGGMRGAVLSVAVYQSAAATMTWLGVGNVEGTLVRSGAAGRLDRTTLIAQRGIVGTTLPSLAPATVQVVPGDVLLFSTDGIRSDFLDGVFRPFSTDGVRDDPLVGHLRAGPPAGLAGAIVQQSAKGTDDALVLAARYLGPPS